MTTRFVGIKEFRQNMAKISEEAHRKKQRLIILRKNQLLFELRPVKDAPLEQLLLDVEEAKEDVRKGRTYTADAVGKLLNL
ncbi:MAG: hypothetical protein Q7S89_03165 [bacterium]|nr:hypothetical protein [bacterium]